MTSVHRSLIPRYRQLHREGNYPGHTVLGLYRDQIGRLIEATGAKTLLDYGCGRGEQYTRLRWHKSWGVKVTMFDPAVPAMAREPTGRFDAVLCVDVLEHVPTSELRATIDQLVALTRQWAFIAVCCRRADNVMADGWNEHVTVRPPAWWRTLLGRTFRGKAVLYLEFTP